MDVAVDVLLSWGLALNLFVWGRVLLRRRAHRSAQRTNSPLVPTPAYGGLPTARSLTGRVVMTSDAWQSDADVLAELDVKILETRERIADGMHAESLIEPGIREVESYLRRAAGENQAGED